MELRTLGIDEGLNINEEVSFAIRPISLNALKNAAKKPECIKQWQEKQILANKSHLELKENDTIKISTLVVKSLIILERCESSERMAMESVLSAILIDLNDDDAKKLIALLLKKVLKDSKVSLEPGSSWSCVNGIFDKVLPDELYLPGWRNIVDILEVVNVNKQSIIPIVKKVFCEKPNLLEDFEFPQNTSSFKRGDNDTLKDVVGNIKSYAEDWKIIQNWIGQVFGVETKLFKEFEENIEQHRKNVMEYFFEKEIFQGNRVVSKSFKIAYVYWNDELKEEKLKKYFNDFLVKDGIDSSLANWYSVLLAVIHAIPEITDVKDRSSLLEGYIQIEEKDKLAKVSINISQAIKFFLLNVVDEYLKEGDNRVLSDSFSILGELSMMVRVLQESQKEYQQVLLNEGDKSSRLPNLKAKKEYFAEEITAVLNQFCENCLFKFSVKEDVISLLDKGFVYKESFVVIENHDSIGMNYIIETDMKYVPMFKEILEGALSWPIDRESRNKHIETVVDSHLMNIDVKEVGLNRMKVKKF